MKNIRVSIIADARMFFCACKLPQRVGCEILQRRVSLCAAFHFQTKMAAENLILSWLVKRKISNMKCQECGKRPGTLAISNSRRAGHIVDLSIHF